MSTAAARQLNLRFSLPRDRFELFVDLALDLRRPIAIFGASGSGKTSLLRAVAGLESAANGHIALDEEVWQDDADVVPAHKRRVGFVFQDARLFAHLDVSGNLDLAAKAARTDGNISRDDVVEKLGIGDLLKRDTASLSGGESQRVAIARTLLAQPRLLLMDEPVSSLDASSRHQTIEYIAALTDSFQLPLIYVTHHAEEVARLAATTVLLENGKVLAAGNTPEVFAQADHPPAGTPSVSILAATLNADLDDLCVVSIGNQQVQIPLIDRAVGEQLQLRIFANDVVIAGRRIEDTSIRNVLEGTIAEIREPGGGTCEVLIRVEQQILKANVTTRAVKDLGLTPGKTVYAMIKSVALGDSRPGNSP